jgi:glycosyltransferase involved in cell wall biosynthesis
MASSVRYTVEMASILLLDSGRRRPPDVLIVASVLPFPARSGPAARVSQVVRRLDALGLGVDLAVLSDSPSIVKDEECASRALEHCRRVLIVPHPSAASPLGRLAVRLRARLFPRRLGDRIDCPRSFVRELRRSLMRGAYGTAIIAGTHLARLGALFRPPTRTILDARRSFLDVFAGFAALGRGGEFERFSDGGREARLASRFGAVLAVSEEEKVSLREIGVDRPIAVVPFAAEAADRGGRDVGDGMSHEMGPVGPPPRLLFVGSESAMNLDGLRFFRTRVLPAIRRQVPAFHLRVAGHAAHHLDPGPGVELVGWLESLDEEYLAATAAVVPARVAGGLRCKAVEALAKGKAIIATPAGVSGIGAEPGREVLVSDDPAELARSAVRLVRDPALRRSLEVAALALAGRKFDPDRVFRPLEELLGIRARSRDPAIMV